MECRTVNFRNIVPVVHRQGLALAALFVIALLPGIGCSRNQPATSTLSQAEVAISEGRYLDALQLSDQELQTRADNADAHVMRGRALALLERWEEAVAAFTRAIELRPEDYDCLYRRENAYKALGLNELAQKDQDLAKSLDPTYRTAYPYEPGTFIRRPPMPDTRRRSADDEEQEGKKRRQSLAAADDPEATNESKEPDEDEASESSRRRGRSVYNVDEEPSDEPTSSNRNLVNNRRDNARPQSTDRRTDERKSPLSERVKKGIGPVEPEALESPKASWKSESEEEQEEMDLTPVPKTPPISTALPTLPPSELDLSTPLPRPSGVPNLPSTGLPHPSRSYGPSPYSNLPTGPFSTGLPVHPPNLPPGYGSSTGTQAPMTTGLQRPMSPAGPPPGGYSPIPGTATGPLSEYLRRLGSGVVPPAGSKAPISTSLPGTAPPTPTGVISSAMPGTEISKPKTKESKPISTALPESASPPR